MNNQQIKSPDPAQSYLRSVVTAVDFEMSHLRQAMTDESHATVGRLIDRWEELVSSLALGPEPEYRECQFCGNIGMRLATRCGSCWSKLPPLITCSEV